MRQAAFLLAAVGAIAMAIMANPGDATVPEPDLAPAEDCIPYNPETLEIINEGPRGWLLSDDGGHHRMAMLADERDAKEALALARRYRAMCFIGRGNRQRDRRNYIIQYWK